MDKIRAQHRLRVKKRNQSSHTQKKTFQNPAIRKWVELPGNYYFASSGFFFNLIRDWNWKIDFCRIFVEKSLLNSLEPLDLFSLFDQVSNEIDLSSPFNYNLSCGFGVRSNSSSSAEFSDFCRKFVVIIFRNGWCFHLTCIDVVIEVLIVYLFIMRVRTGNIITR